MATAAMHLAYESMKCGQLCKISRMHFFPQQSKEGDQISTMAALLVQLAEISL